jgi:hypothetical protein
VKDEKMKIDGNRTQVIIGQLALVGLISYNAGLMASLLVVFAFMVLNGIVGTFVDFQKKTRLYTDLRNGVLIRLNDREQEALAKLAEHDELTPERVMVQALRTYQGIVSGYVKLVHDNPDGGCGGSDE